MGLVAEDFGVGMSDLNEWEAEYNNLLVGGASIYALTKISGLDTPDARVDETQKEGDHGSFISAPWMDKRTITLEGNLDDDINDIQSRLDDLKLAFTRQAADLPLRFRRPGDITKIVYCVPIHGPAYDMDLDYNLGTVPWVVQLIAGDPLIYDDSAVTQSIVPEALSGISFSLSFSLDFQGGSGGQATISNDGNISTAPSVRIQGPCTNPQVANLTQGKTMKVDIVLGMGDYLDIDFAAKTIVLNGTASRYSNKDFVSTWWSLQPGDNVVKFAADAMTGSTLATVSWRSAWF